MTRVGIFVSATVLAVAFATACTRLPPPRSAGHELALSKCGACHLRPEPGTRDRDFLARKLAEDHERRVPMTVAERSALLDYLAPEPTTASAMTGSSAATRALP